MPGMLYIAQLVLSNGAFEINAACDLEADPPVLCGVNEMCGENIVS